jgi:hypothetical protein
MRLDGPHSEKPSNRDCFRRLLSVPVYPTLLTSNSLFQRRANSETLACACGSGWRPQKIRYNHDRDVDNDHVVIRVALVIAMLLVRP